MRILRNETLCSLELSTIEINPNNETMSIELSEPRSFVWRLSQLLRVSEPELTFVAFDHLIDYPSELAHALVAFAEEQLNPLTIQILCRNERSENLFQHAYNAAKAGQDNSLTIRLTDPFAEVCDDVNTVIMMEYLPLLENLKIPFKCVTKQVSLIVLCLYTEQLFEQAVEHNIDNVIQL